MNNLTVTNCCGLAMGKIKKTEKIDGKLLLRPLNIVVIGLDDTEKEIFLDRVLNECKKGSKKEVIGKEIVYCLLRP